MLAPTAPRRTHRVLPREAVTLLRQKPTTTQRARSSAAPQHELIRETHPSYTSGSSDPITAISTGITPSTMNDGSTHTPMGSNTCTASRSARCSRSASA